MSIEDINYLKKQSIKQSYTFLVDSNDRDRREYPHPSEYRIDFTTPFKNVIGLEIVDASIPKTMYNIDKNNNKLVFYIANSDEENHITMIDVENTRGDSGVAAQNLKTYDKTKFTTIEIPPGDYTTKSFIDKMRSILNAGKHDLTIFAVDTPPELTNRIYFQSSQPFILDMHLSTMVEVLGFDLYTSNDEEYKSHYTFNDQYNDLVGFEKLYHSFKVDEGIYNIKSPGMMYLLGHKYLLLKCPEIEQHLYRSLSYAKYNLGLAKIRINSYGFNDDKPAFLKVPVREFHPIGKLSKLTFRFETKDGELYDFKGVNHHMIFAIYYYEPKQTNVVSQSILNPEYNPSFVDYLYTQEDQEGESDEDEEDISRDNINIYRRHELQYGSKGRDINNDTIAHKLSQRQFEMEKQLKYLKEKVKHGQKESSSEGSSEASSESEE